MRINREFLHLGLKNMSINEDSSKEIKKLDAAKVIMQSAQKNMTEMFTGIEKIIDNAKFTLTSLEKEKIRLNNVSREQETKITGLTDKQARLLKEYESVKEELEKFTRMAVADGEVRVEDMKATLTIYRILLEEIWQSQPHFKVLWLLHGDREDMDVDQLKGASGVSGAMILHACHELSKANLITFDLETKKAKLVRRLFPKRDRR